MRAANAATTRLLVNVAGLVACDIEALAGPDYEIPLAPPKVSAPSTNQLRQLLLDDILRSHMLLSLPLVFSVFLVASFFFLLLLSALFHLYNMRIPNNGSKNANPNSGGCDSSAARCLYLHLLQPARTAHSGQLFPLSSPPLCPRPILSVGQVHPANPCAVLRHVPDISCGS